MKKIKNILWAVALACALPILSGCSAGELEKPEIKTLDAPVVTAILNDVKVELEWTPVINATSYKVEYKNATETEFAPAGTVSYSPYVFENLELSNTYDFRVKALCGETESAWSEIVTVEVVRLLPVPAVTFNPGITYIDVKWKAIEGAETYRVEYKGYNVCKFVYRSCELSRILNKRRNSAKRDREHGKYCGLTALIKHEEKIENSSEHRYER